MHKRLGVVHPAFLRAIRKNIVFEFYVANSIPKAEEALLNGRIRHVTAGFVRGIEDIFLKKFVSDASCIGLIPTLDIPFCYLSADELGKIIDNSIGVAQTKILISPRGILKVNGVEIPHQSDNELNAQYDAIARCFQDANWEELCSQAIVVANGVSEEATIPEQLAPIFLSDIVQEPIPDGIIRETYILLVADDHNKLAIAGVLQAHIEATLMKDVRVRDIFRIEKTEYDKVTEQYAHKSQFQFIVRLVCAASDVDVIIYNLQTWSGRRNIRLGTRTYDFWRHVKNEENEGLLQEQFGQGAEPFLRSVFNDNTNLPWQTDASEINKLNTYASIMNEQIDTLRGLRGCQKIVESFYKAVYTYNVASEIDRMRFYTDTRQSWTVLYQTFEDAIMKLLSIALGINLSSSRDEIVIACKKRFGNNKSKNAAQNDQKATDDSAEKNEKAPEMFERDPVRLFVKYYAILGGNKALCDMVRANLDPVTGKRNLTVHNLINPQWKEFIKIEGIDWRERMELMSDVTRKLCVMLRDTAIELSRAQVSAAPSGDKRA